MRRLRYGHMLRRGPPRRRRAPGGSAGGAQRRGGAWGGRPGGGEGPSFGCGGAVFRARKAAADAWALGEALQAAGGDVAAALEQWERRQLAVGRRVFQRTRDAGERSQFENTWPVGAPLPFGLYETGDSELP